MWQLTWQFLGDILLKPAGHTDDIDIEQTNSIILESIFVLIKNRSRMLLWLGAE